MIDQLNKILSELKKIDNLTYDECYEYLKKYFISKNKKFKKSDKLEGDEFGEILAYLCEVESDLDINIWDEDLELLKTIGDLTLIVTHELLYDKYKNN